MDSEPAVEGEARGEPPPVTTSGKGMTTVIVLDVILGVVMRVSLSMVPDQELIRESSVRLATMAVSGMSSRALVLEVLHQVPGIVLQVNNPSLANVS